MYIYLNPDKVQAMVSLRQQQLATVYQNVGINGADDHQRLQRLRAWLADSVLINLGQGVFCFLVVDKIWRKRWHNALQMLWLLS